MKSRIIAAVEGKFFFNTIRSWAFVNSLEDCEVDWCFAKSRTIAAVADKFCLIPFGLGQL